MPVSYSVSEERKGHQEVGKGSLVGATVRAPRLKDLNNLKPNRKDGVFFGERYLR